LDTGSDVTIAGHDVADRCGWTVEACEVSLIRVANNEEIIIDGVATVELKVGGTNTVLDVLVTHDLSGLILGIGWMTRQGPFTFDFLNDRVRFGTGKWLELLKESKSQMVRRCYVDHDTELWPTGQTEVDVHIRRSGMNEPRYQDVLEPETVTSLSRVYPGRSLLPAQFSHIKVPVLNASDKSQILARGTELGVVEPVDLLDDGSAVADEVRSDATEVDVELTAPEAEVVAKMMANLPSELDEEQRAKVEALLMRHRKILSTGDHDIGRTHLVEHHIDTRDARPIRQPLRRQAFVHAKFIKEETDEMLKHGTDGVDHATDRFASGLGRHESGAATPSDVADRRGIETRPDRLGESSAGANVVARGRLANEPSLHVGSAALPSGSMNANADADRSGADRIADLQGDSMSSGTTSSDCARARNTAECRAAVGSIPDVVEQHTAAGDSRNLDT